MEEWREISSTAMQIFLTTRDFFIPHLQESDLCRFHSLTEHLRRRGGRVKGRRARGEPCCTILSVGFR
jgi:hypothetical protein